MWAFCDSHQTYMCIFTVCKDSGLTQSWTVSILSVGPAKMMAAAITSHCLQLDLLGQDGQIWTRETDTKKKKERINQSKEPSGGGRRRQEVVVEDRGQCCSSWLVCQAFVHLCLETELQLLLPVQLEAPAEMQLHLCGLNWRSWFDLQRKLNISDTNSDKHGGLLNLDNTTVETQTQCNS